MAEKLSVILTTLNNARTLRSCLESVKWADEIVLLDSLSTDETLAIAREFGCVIYQHPFMGYGPQKRSAMEKATHNWVLLLDADEALSPALQIEIRAVLANKPARAAYEIPRQEQLFWRMCSPATAMNHYLRLFDKQQTSICNMPIHAAPKTKGDVGRLQHPFYHFGEHSIHAKVSRVNDYSTGLLPDKLRRKWQPGPWIMLLYPPFFFFRLYILKRNFLNGWGGLITSVVGAFYVFIKYAKVYEHMQSQKHGRSLLPPCAPFPPTDASEPTLEPEEPATVTPLRRSHQG